MGNVFTFYVCITLKTYEHMHTQTYVHSTTYIYPLGYGTHLQDLYLSSSTWLTVEKSYDCKKDFIENSGWYSNDFVVYRRGNMVSQFFHITLKGIPAFILEFLKPVKCGFEDI